jgi:hypothetical protein
MGDRVMKLEALVEHLLTKVSDGSDSLSGLTAGQDDGSPRHGTLTPVFTRTESSKFLAAYEPSAVSLR